MRHEAARRRRRQRGASLTDPIVRAIAVTVRLVEVRRGREGERFARHAARRAAADAAEAARSGAQLARLIATRDDVDHAAHRVRPVERRSDAAQNLDSLDRFERHPDVQRVVRRLHVGHPHTVHEHDDLLRRAASNRDVGLSRRPPVHVDAHHRGKDVRQVSRRRGRDLLARDHIDAAHDARDMRSRGDDRDGVERRPLLAHEARRVTESQSTTRRPPARQTRSR